MTRSGSGSELLGRESERRALDELLTAVRTGRSATLVLRGEAGIGKTELLRYVRGHASDCRVVSAAGVQSEMEISYAGLHQLCRPLLTGLDRLPGPSVTRSRRRSVCAVVMRPTGSWWAWPR
ncbi:BREX system ATP-binding domain-containing protein [Promicromonospora thailandica]|uniref:AAA ATPase domain-containing protein n=1 Tax=Promicromonospora thailandica TaxID=765201 RepID=A0A9X2G6X8_9MICO|nr:ATP-binding protein [Promicromonospora thailandica]MCP2266873.1 AAA ATPase domain-containing protein [Promicromonospora thailandica]BFF16537.1 hypothetical protein GCM10025730_00580 [Promicromonospora thailandica]